ncbi:MAG: FKBP-type peptidyl-prolyl cis-trans isomerase [Planctomycetota bacterium]
MPITVLSPYSGRAIKARDQDIGRALRDEEGRIFYIVERPNGGGHYAAPTRKGSEKDLERYDALETKGEIARETHHEQSAQQLEAHDARGTGRSGGGFRRFVVVLILLALLAAAGYFAANQLGLIDPADTPTDPAAPNTAAPQPAAAAPDTTAEMVADATANVSRPTQGSGPPTTHPDPPIGVAPTAPPSQLGGVAYAPPADRAQLQAPVEEGWQERASGLRFRVEEPGYGEPARAGQFVTVEYEVRLATGTVIDASSANGPMRFVLWSGQAMRAWDEAVAGMQRGERREVVIPPSLIEDDAMGDAALGVDGLKLRATVELLSVQRGVEIEVIDVGANDGQMVMPGDRVELDYVGVVEGASDPFASSAVLGEPLRFVVGSGDVVPGLDLGVLGMAEGETRRVTIPPYLAYGRRGFGRLIPAEATLVYDLMLRRVTDAR